MIHARNCRVQDVRPHSDVAGNVNDSAVSASPGVFGSRRVDAGADEAAVFQIR